MTDWSSAENDSRAVVKHISFGGKLKWKLVEQAPSIAIWYVDVLINRNGGNFGKGNMAMRKNSRSAYLQ